MASVWSATASFERMYRVHRYGELWCYTSSERGCQVTRGAKRKEKSMPVEGSSVRATISFPSDMYQTLEEIARQKKVSLAWVVREAVEQYLANKWPLFKGKV
jgi:Ribbon-helix-helix protein, copG family